MHMHLHTELEIVLICTGSYDTAPVTLDYVLKQGSKWELHIALDAP